MPKPPNLTGSLKVVENATPGTYHIDESREMKTCFVIAPIGKPDSETRKRSDLVLEYVVTPALAAVGYKPLRADQISEPGVITHQVIQHIDLRGQALLFTVDAIAQSG
jgi:hypothetical protein